MIARLGFKLASPVKKPTTEPKWVRDLSNLLFLLKVKEVVFNRCNRVIQLQFLWEYP